MFIDKRLSVNLICANCGEKIPAVCTESDNYDITIAIEEHICSDPNGWCRNSEKWCLAFRHYFVDGMCVQCGKSESVPTPREPDKRDSAASQAVSTPETLSD